MKTISFLFGLMVALASLTQSCESKEAVKPKGYLEFALATTDNDMLLKSIKTDSSVVFDGFYLLFSVQNANGGFVFENEWVPLIVFGNGFLSPQIEFEVGDYQLTKLMVIDAEGKVLMASPVQGSELAYLVDEPLPTGFNIEAGKVSHLSPEVLDVANTDATMFGYAVFDISVVKPVYVYVAVYVNDSLSMMPATWTSADLVVKAANGWAYSFDLEAGVNKIALKSGIPWYSFSVAKDGYGPMTYQFALSELMLTTPDNPLRLTLSADSLHRLVLQPGAANGKDALVVDLKPETNLGDSPFFEASWTSEPILTVMRTTQSLIYFNAAEQLPNNAVIKRVTLTLAMEHDSVWVTDDTTDPGYMYWPRGVLRQIVEPWDEHTVTWSNQPKTIEANQVYVDINPVLSTIFRTFDVTSLFVPYQEVAAPNYGMMLMLSFDKGQSVLRFASSDHSEVWAHPKLVVFYTIGY